MVTTLGYLPYLGSDMCYGQYLNYWVCFVEILQQLETGILYWYLHSAFAALMFCINVIYLSDI